MHSQGTGLLTNDYQNVEEQNCKYRCLVLLTITVINDRPILLSEILPHIDKSPSV
jgi:hypothetical protein